MTVALKMKAGEIVSRYLSKAGTLHDLTREAAVENHLAPEQIEYLAQLVNRETQLRVYADKGPSGVYNFDLVQPDKVISSMNEDYEEAFMEPKTASRPSAEPYRPLLKTAEMEGEDCTGRYPTELKLMQMELAKLEVEEQMAQEELAKCVTTIEKEMHSLGGILKQAALGEGDEVSLPHVLRFIKDEKGEEALKLAETLLNNLTDEDKYLQAKMPDSMILHETPVSAERIVGSQAIIKHLNTIVQQHDGFDYHGGRLHRIRDGIRYVTERIERKLTHSSNV